ncbi:MAG: prepilin-type N-terminal cleavage/methylation domain-containing protein [Candidatus Omnitrophota bacterium]
MHKESGFTLTEIMVVLLVMGLLVVIAIPNISKTANTTRAAICINNLRQIDSAIDRWAVTNSINTGTSITAQQETEIYTYIRSGMPVCPSRGIYTMGTVGSYPQVTCNIAGHALD